MISGAERSRITTLLRTSDTRSSSIGSCAMSGTEVFIHRQLCNVRHRGPAAYHRPHQPAIDKRLGRGIRPGASVDLFPLDRQHDIGTGGIAADDPEVELR